MENRRTALMFCPTLYRLILHASGQPCSAHSEVCSEVSGLACLMPVMEIKSVQCYAAHASENTMAYRPQAEYRS